MKKCKHWLVKILNLNTKFELVVYIDGRIYVNGKEQLGILSKYAMRKINNMISGYLPVVKRFGYLCHSSDDILFKFWNDEDVTQLSARGWRLKNDFCRILLDRKYYDKLFVDLSYYNDLLFETII